MYFSVCADYCWKYNSLIHLVGKTEVAVWVLEVHFSLEHAGFVSVTPFSAPLGCPRTAVSWNATGVTLNTLLFYFTW